VLAFEFPFVNIVKIDAHKNEKFADRADIHAFPTWFMVKDGVFIEKGTGALTQDELIDKIKQYQYVEE
jgi:thioredoxin-like negative regulator of GroEL